MVHQFGFGVSANVALWIRNEDRIKSKQIREDVSPKSSLKTKATYLKYCITRFAVKYLGMKNTDGVN